MASVAQTLQAAISHHRDGELDKAETLYREVVRLDPCHADALHLLGLAAHQKKKNDSAVDYISRAIAVKDNFAPYHSNLGAAYRALGDYREAIDCFHRAIEIDPNFADGHFNLATLLHDQGNIPVARQHFELGLNLSPNYGPGWMAFGRTLELNGEFANSIECFRKAVELQPSQVDAHCALASALHRENRIDETIAAYRQALRLHPQLAQREDNPCRMLSRLVALSDASVTYERAMSLHRDAERVLDHMVRAVEQTPLLNDPFEHFYLDRVFPQDFYPRLLEALPENRYYEELPHKDAMLPNGRSARLRLKLDEAGIRKLPDAYREFWMNYAPILYSERLKFAIYGKFGRKLHSSPQVMLLRDVAGYQILPHPDIPDKKITTQFYLPRNDSQTHLGTWLYTQEGGDFAPAKQFRFQQNSGYSFLVSKTSWHGVEQTTLNDGPRDSLMIIFYRA